MTKFQKSKFWIDSFVAFSVGYVVVYSIFSVGAVFKEKFASQNCLNYDFSKMLKFSKMLWYFSIFLGHLVYNFIKYYLSRINLWPNAKENVQFWWKMSVWEGRECKRVGDIHLIGMYVLVSFNHMQVCKYASMQVCKYASMQVWKYASMQICKYAHICKYVSMQVCSYMQRFS